MLLDDAVCKDGLRADEKSRVSRKTEVLSGQFATQELVWIANHGG